VRKCEATQDKSSNLNVDCDIIIWALKNERILEFHGGKPVLLINALRGPFFTPENWWNGSLKICDFAIRN
jgi:hypothetical protein